MKWLLRFGGLVIAVVALVGICLTCVRRGGTRSGNGDRLIDEAATPEAVRSSPHETAVDPRAEKGLPDRFLDLTDRWSKSVSEQPTDEDVRNFVQALASVPRSRRLECIENALNLIPDRNANLLVGALAEVSLGTDVVVRIFHDLANRDDTIRLPALKAVYRDRTHPSWSDAAWLLEADGARRRVE